jgi:hypothetical protein
MASIATVESVNGQTGVVLLDADDVDDSTTARKFVTAEQLTKLAGIEPGATSDLSGAEIVASIDAELGGTAWRVGQSLVVLTFDLGLVRERPGNLIDLGMIA